MSEDPAAPTIPDPRPTVVEIGGRSVLQGWRCQSCAHPLALPGPWCPVCRGELVETTFPHEGEVWSSTAFRIPFQGRTPPIVLAYVDVDGGPRVLAHVADSVERLRTGQRVAIAGVTGHGDLLVAPIRGRTDS